MSKGWLGLVLGIGLAAATVNQADAAPFAPLFQVTEITGSCNVKLPDSGDYVPAERGKAYPYGTVVATGPESSLSFVFSPGNSCNILPGSAVVVAEDTSMKDNKVLRLLRGKVELNLAENYQEKNRVEVLTRCASVDQLSGGETSVDAKLEADLHVVVVNCNKGEVSVDGPSFLIPLIKDDDKLTIACSEDRGFIRLRDLKGEYDVRVQDGDGATRMVQMVEDSVVKILRKPSDADMTIMLVTILEIGPDGEILNVNTFPEKRTGEREPPEEEIPEKPGEKPGETTTWPSTTSSTTTTTTTTTVPPGDLLRRVPPPVTTTTTRPTTTTTTKPDMTPTGRD